MMAATPIPLTEAYRPYLPRLVIERVSRYGRPDEPSEVRLATAVLFADVSGFTPLTEAFAARGPTGAEALTQVLNDYFGRLIAVIDEAGGDIVKFAGDAIMVIWPVPEGTADLAAPTLAATACALRMQAAVAGYEAEGHLLAIRTAVAAGNLAVLHLGGEFRRWEFAIAGAPLHEVGAACDSAAPGEVVVSSAAWALIQDRGHAIRVLPAAVCVDRVDAEATLARERRPALSEAAGAALQNYMPAAVVRRLEAGHTEYLGELRLLTVLFVNLPDIHYDTPLEVAQRAMRALQRALYVPFEGSINKLSVDDKGVTLVAALGLPPFAHEDDPARGALAALAMHKVLQALQLRGSVGVSTGRVYCGVVGSRERREYTIMGDRVNVAARLMQHAAGGVLCDDETVRRAQARVKFGAPVSLMLKGKSEPMSARAPLRTARRTMLNRSAIRVVGRERETAKFASALDALLANGTRGTLLIQGEAGIGKTALAEAFVQQARDRGARVGTCHGDRIESTTRYRALQPLLLGLLNLADVPRDARCDRVLAMLDADAATADLLPLLNPVLQLGRPETPLTAEMSGQVRSDNVAALVTRLLVRTVGDGHVVIVVDDAHWLDSPSRALLQSLLDAPLPILCVFTARPTPEIEETLVGDRQVESLSLTTLDDSATAAIVAARLGVESLPEQVLVVLRERAQGHPLFAIEIGLSLRDTGLIQIAAGVVSCPDDAALGAFVPPSSIEAVVTARLDRLQPEQLLILKIASVLGRTFTVEQIQALHPAARDGETLAAILESLPIDLHCDPDSGAFSFRTRLTRTVVYRLMLESHRRSLHRACALWHEQTYADRLAPHYARIANHWRDAGEPERALPWQHLAATQAVSANACIEALGFLDAIETTLASKPELEPTAVAGAERSLLRARALLSLGRPDDVRSAGLEGLKRLGHAFPATGTGVAGSLLAQGWVQLWHRLWGARIEQGAAAERENTLERDLCGELVMSFFFDNDVARMLLATLRAMNAAERLPAHVIGPVRAYAALAAVFEAVPWRRMSDRYRRLAREAIGHGEQPRHRGWMALIDSMVAGARGDWALAETASAEGMRCAMLLGDQRRWEEAAGNLCLLRTTYGRYEGPEDGLIAEVLQSATRRRSVQATVWGLSGFCIHYHHQQREAELAAALDRTEAFIETTPGFFDPIALLEVLALRAQQQLRVGDAERARSCVERAAGMIRSFGPPSQYRNLPSGQFVAEAAIDLVARFPGDQEALRWRRETVAYVFRVARRFVIGRPRAAWLRGRLRWEQSDRTGALRHWRRGRVDAARVGMRYDELMLTTVLARLESDPTLDTRAGELRTLIGIGTPLETRFIDAATVTVVPEPEVRVHARRSAPRP